MDNMGNISRLDAEAFAFTVLKELGLDDWKLEWVTDGSACIIDMKLLLLHVPNHRSLKFRIYAGYPWEVKEDILHEIAHIFSPCNTHGRDFYLEYIKLLTKFMVKREP